MPPRRFVNFSDLLARKLVESMFSSTAKHHYESLCKANFWLLYVPFTFVGQTFVRGDDLEFRGMRRSMVISNRSEFQLGVILVIARKYSFPWACTLLKIFWTIEPFITFIKCYCWLLKPSNIFKNNKLVYRPYSLRRSYSV